MLGRAHLCSGARVGRGGLVLLIDGCCFVWSALYLALTLLILLFLARDLALALLKRIVRLGQESLLECDGGRSLPRHGQLRAPVCKWWDSVLLRTFRVNQ